MGNNDKTLQWLSDIAVAYGLKLIGALVVLIIGLWVVKLIMKGVRKAFEKREMDASLQPFLLSLIGIVNLIEINQLDHCHIGIITKTIS